MTVGLSLWRVVVSLGAVLGLVFVTSWLLRLVWRLRSRAFGPSGPGSGILRVVDSVPLGQTASLHMVYAAKKLLLISVTGSAGSRVRCLMQTDDPSVCEQVASGARETPASGHGSSPAAGWVEAARRRLSQARLRWRSAPASSKFPLVLDEAVRRAKAEHAGEDPSDS